MKIGLAFEGGGGKGAFQIGAWKALHESGFDRAIDAVSGTSIGAMNAFLFAYGNFNKAEEIWLSLTWSQVFSNPEKNINLWDDEGGLFSRQGVKDIIKDFDLNKVNKNSKPCYAACLKVADNNRMHRIIDFNGKLISGGLLISRVVDPFVSGPLLNLLRKNTKFPKN